MRERVSREREGERASFEFRDSFERVSRESESFEREFRGSACRESPQSGRTQVHKPLYYIVFYSIFTLQA